MPTYQYSCIECGHFLEQFQSFSDDSLTECPSCGGKLRKVFNAVGVVFKGSGFYRNDSRSASSTSEAGSSSNGSSEKTSSESSGSSDSPSKGSANGGSSSDSPSKGSANGGSSSKSPSGAPAAAS